MLAVEAALQAPFCVRSARATSGGRTNHTSEVSHASKSSPNSRTWCVPRKSRSHHTPFSCLAALYRQLRFVHGHRCWGITNRSQSSFLGLPGEQDVVQSDCASQFFTRSRANDAVPCVTQFRHPAPQPPRLLVMFAYSIIYLLFSYSLETYFPCLIIQLELIMNL